jgi:hypothetical protein
MAWLPTFLFGPPERPEQRLTLHHAGDVWRFREVPGEFRNVREAIAYAGKFMRGVPVKIEELSNPLGESAFVKIFQGKGRFAGRYMVEEMRGGEGFMSTAPTARNRWYGSRAEARQAAERIADRRRKQGVPAEVKQMFRDNPLRPGASQEVISYNIRKMMREGYPHNQALAAALNSARKTGRGKRAEHLRRQARAAGIR